MKKKIVENSLIKQIFGGRAPRMIAVAVSAFLCMLTIFEFVALKMEWDIPALRYIVGGADSYIFEEYQNGELALDDSTENIILEEIGTVGTSDATDTDEEESDNLSPGETDGNGENADTNTDTDTNAGAEGETEDAQEEVEFPYYLKVNRQQNVITAYTLDENGEYTVPYKAILCSTGLYNATPLGVFHISDKYIWRQLNGGVYGQYASRVHGGVLFHSVPYRSKSKDSLYTDKYNKLGQQASMGCIRLTVEDAKWIAENCPSGTTVEVYDDAENPGPLGKPEGIKIDSDNPNKGWDPTDPDEDNPWHAWSEDM